MMGMEEWLPFLLSRENMPSILYLEVTPSLKMAGDQLFLGQLCPKSTYLTHTKDLYSSDKKNRFVLVLV